MSLKETNLEIDTVVAELRTLRLRSLETRQRRDRPPKLPSRKVLVGVADGLRAVLFPNRPGLRKSIAAVRSPGLTREPCVFWLPHLMHFAYITYRFVLLFRS